MKPWTVKSCGKMHAYCRECNPAAADAVVASVQQAAEKISATLKGRPVKANLLPRTAAWGANIGNALRGRSRQGRPYSPAARERVKHRGAGIPKTADHIAAMRRHRHTDATKEHMAEIRAKRIHTDSRFTNTQPQLRLAQFLETAGFEVALEVRFGRYVVDIYLPEQHVAFEADGDFWHSLPGRQEYDGKRDAWLLERHQLPVVRLWQREIAQL